MKPKNTKETESLENSKFSDRALHILFVVASEIALTAFAVQGALSVIHTTRGLQVGISVGLIFTLLVVKYRSR